jgi:ATP-binding cassette subfamily F protein uup
MALLTLTNAHLAFGHVALLDGADFALETAERVALIGRNGTGKSSMLKILAGLDKPDDGTLQVERGLRRTYVPQEPQFAPGISVFDAVSDGVREAKETREKFENHDGVDHDEMDRLQTRLEALGGWDWERRVDETLHRLDLDPQVLVEKLSGGVRKRVALAQALVATPDVLLLDEPTNHLDLDAIDWLADLLKSYRGSLILISHDRAFIDATATRIVELDRGKLRSYPGNFTAYESTKQRELESEALANARADKLLAQEEIWIRKGVEARRTRSVARIGRLEVLRATRAARRDQVGQVKLEVATGGQSGKIVAALENVTMRYGDRVLIDKFTTTVLRGDKIGLIGPNGCGKTTLLKLILGQLKATSGDIKLGTMLNVAYFDQMRAGLKLDSTLADTISPGSEWVEIGNSRKHIMSYLSDFLFAPERANAKVMSLSGGERNRLLLARLFALPANVLVLDEPTNDLDIQTLELLEELLTDYDGTVLLVSHDRQFLDNVVTSVFASEGGGKWREYVGGFTDWQIQRERSERIALDAARDTAKQAKKEDTSKDSGAGRNSQRSTKLPYKEVRELEALPAQIAALEAEQKSIAVKLEDGSVFAKDPKEGTRLSERHAAIDEELLVALERWEELEAKRK